MKYKVFLVKEAQDDLNGIFDYVLVNDSIAKAKALFQNIKDTCSRLETFPNRGHVPPELKRIDVMDYLEIHYKPYRIIYQVIEKKVFIHCVLDGRRELQDVLQDRLIR